MKTEHHTLLIPKNHFVSLEMFRSEPLLNWTFTESVLFTAYDVFRSQDFWINEVISSGSTIKERLTQEGFPKQVSIVVDTGIFEIEAKKAGMSEKLGIEVNYNLSNDEIKWAYQLAGCDFFVVPDQIILPTDTEVESERKLEMMRENLLDFERDFPTEKLIAVLQGRNDRQISDLFEFYIDHGIRRFAAGGIIPLWKYDKNQYHERLLYLRKITEGNSLHIFGLPKLSLLHLYKTEYHADSIDTSILIYLTAQRKYVVGNHLIPIRLANFEACDCQGCENIKLSVNPRTMEFFVNLYIHNVIEAQQLCNGNSRDDDPRIKKEKHDSSIYRDMRKDVEEEHRGWYTADGNSLN